MEVKYNIGQRLRWSIGRGGEGIVEQIDEWYWESDLVAVAYKINGKFIWQDFIEGASPSRSVTDERRTCGTV